MPIFSLPTILIAFEGDALSSWSQPATDSYQTYYEVDRQSGIKSGTVNSDWH
jgi:hypothetical protein